MKSHLLFDGFKKFGLTSHRYTKQEFHKSYHISFSNPFATSSIYEALIKTSKALDHFKSHYGAGEFSIHLFTPIIVLDGNLWSATLDKLGKVKLKEVDSLSVVFPKLTKDKKSGMCFEEEQICDVVTRKSFDRYLGIIRKDNTEIYRAWTNFNKLKFPQPTRTKKRKSEDSFPVEEKLESSSA